MAKIGVGSGHLQLGQLHRLNCGLAHASFWMSGFFRKPSLSSLLSLATELAELNESQRRPR